MGKQKKQRYNRVNYNKLLNELSRNNKTKWIGSVPQSSEEYQDIFDDPDIKIKLIRKAVPAETKNLELYCAFFTKARISTQFMVELLERHSALLPQMINENALKFQVGEDTWIVELTGQGGCRLLHNNYMKTLDGGRVFKPGYHEQRIPCNCSPEDAMRTAMEYRFNTHNKG